jgi:hypothetical protein
MGCNVSVAILHAWFAIELFLRSFSGGVRRFLRHFTLVRVELLLHTRLSELTRICRELHMTGFTGPERRNAADSLEYPKSALWHVSVSHSALNCASLRELDVFGQHFSRCSEEIRGGLVRIPRCHAGGDWPSFARLDGRRRPSLRKKNRTFFLFTDHCGTFRDCATVSSCCEKCCRCGLSCSLCCA